MRRLIVGFAVLVIAVTCDLGQTQAAIEFFDDFNDGNAEGWVFPFTSGQSQSPGLWSIDVENGVLVQHTASDGHKALVNNLFISDQVIETQVLRDGYAGIAFWYQEVDERWANFVTINHNVQTGLWVSEAIDGVWFETHYGKVSPWIGSDTWHDWRVETDSLTGSVKVNLDGVHLFTHYASTSYRTGLSGVNSGNAAGYFDNFRITSPVPEPSAIAVWSFLAIAGIGYGRWRKQRSL